VSWLIVFSSAFVPIVLLFLLVMIDRLHGEPSASATC
jgi:hypothetical protein